MGLKVPVSKLGVTECVSDLQYKSGMKNYTIHRNKDNLLDWQCKPTTNCSSLQYNSSHPLLPLTGDHRQNVCDNVPDCFNARLTGINVQL